MDNPNLCSPADSYYAMEFQQCLRMNLCPECGDILVSDNRDIDHPAYCCRCANDLFDDEAE